jgi:positive regulator of sigma E activity
MERLSVKPQPVPWLIRLFWDEMLTLLVCISLDVIEYVFPLLLIPVAGDLVDIIGLSLCIYFFPIFTATWLIWYVLKRRQARLKQDDELKDWR